MLDTDELDEEDEGDGDVTPRLVVQLGDFLADDTLFVWHNAEYHLYRQPGYDPARFSLVHKASTEGLLELAPVLFLLELLGDVQGVGHVEMYCVDCQPPFLDEHPTLKEEYKRLVQEHVR